MQIQFNASDAVHCNQANVDRERCEGRREFTVRSEMEKRNKIAQTQVLDLRNSTKNA